MSVKDQVLAALEKNKGTSISGEALANQMNVSRTAVWKAIKSLREEGYEIQALTNRGYSLSTESDVLSAQGIRPYLDSPYRDLPLHIYQSIDSTNNQARILASGGAPHGTAVLALHQTQGKGRMGRTFVSPDRMGIYLSLLLKPDFDVSHSLLVTTAASVAVVHAIKKVCDLDPMIKWVNDIYLDGKKICGILTEALTDFETGQIEYLVLGIGINCNTKGIPDDLKNIVGALPDTVSKNHLAAEVINQVMTLVQNLEAERFIREYQEHSMVTGQNILVYKGGYKEDVRGIPARALGIDKQGGLKVLYSSGEQETLTSGEVSIRLEPLE